MITRENYESYYIDFLDGTLSPEAEAAFLLFLEENPDLQLEENSLPSLNAAAEEMDPLEKQLLKKKENEPLIISHQTIDYALIAQLEKELNADEEKNLQLWLINHPEYQKEQTLYGKTIVTPNTSLVFPKKDELYQNARIVPLWLYRSAIAASVITVIGVSAFFSLNRMQTGSIDTPQISKQLDKKHDGQKQPAKKSIDYAPLNTERTYSKNTPFSNAPVKVKKVIEDNSPSPQPNEKQDNKAPNQNITNERGTLLPKQPEIAEGITEKTNPVTKQENPGNYVAWGSNPIEPITTGLSKKLNTTIDFRRQKETKGKESGFYLKIGKFEIMNKKGADRD